MSASVVSNNEQMIYLTPTPVRIWHWLNALGIVTLSLTGIQIRFPEFVNLFGSYKSAISLHNTAGIVVSISYILWLFYYLFIAGTLVKLYVPTLDDIKRGMIRQALFYFFHFFRGGPNPHHSMPDDKFNPMQKFAYLMIMLILLPLVIVSGILIMNVAPLRELIILVGGIKILVSAHYLIACCFTAFLFVHIYLATMGHTPFAHFVPMWTGWEKIEGHGEEDGHAHEHNH
jgi:thiosulfate reductase cytochrome b subunit